MPAKKPAANDRRNSDRNADRNARAARSPEGGFSFRVGGIGGQRDNDSAAGEPTNTGTIRGIEGFLGGLSGLLSKLSELAEKGQQLKDSGQFKSASGKDVNFHYGVSVRTMDGGREVRVEPFGNTRNVGPVNAAKPAARHADARAPRETAVREVREPMTDVFEEADHVLVIAEMPGVGKDDLQLDVAGDILSLSAENRGKRYQKEVMLPCAVAKGKPAVKCNNGVFEIRLDK